MYRCKLFFSMALSGMVLFSSALAQSYGDGTVLTGQDEPVKQARVEITHQDGADSQTVYTDDEGVFSFNNLYTGTGDGGRPEGVTVAGSPGRMHTAVYSTPGDDDGVARLYGMNGRLVREISVNSQGGVTTASFGEGLSPGVYLYNDGKHTAKVVHTSNGPRGSQSTSSFKSSSERDMYMFTVTPQDGISNVLFDETSSDQNLESGYNTVDLTVEPTAFMHSVSGEGNVSGAELVFENEGEQIFQTTTDGDGTYQTGSDYLDNRTEDFNITITPPNDDYESLDTLITRNWNEGEGSTFDFTLDDKIPANTTFAFKVGWTSGDDSDYYSNVGLTASTPDQITYDTVMNADFYNTPKQTTPPATPNDPNHGVSYDVDIEILQQMDGDNPENLVYNGELAFDRQVSFHYGDLSGGDVQDFKDFIIDGDSLFHGYSTTAPLDDPNRPHKLIDEHFNSDNIPMDYNPITNPQTESIGWNIQYGGNETWAINREFESYLPYTTKAVAGGDININFVDEAGTLKELYGRANEFGDVTAGDSFMNLNATYPTIQDRISYKFIGESDKRVMETYDSDNQTITFPATVGLQEYIDTEE